MRSAGASTGPGAAELFEGINFCDRAAIAGRVRLFPGLRTLRISRLPSRTPASRLRELGSRPLKQHRVR